LHDELGIAVRGLEAELRLNRDREELLEAQLGDTLARLKRLAAVRAAYTNQVAETAQRARHLEQAENDLAEARAAHAAAKAGSLISRIDEPHTGAKPLGPSRAMIVLAGLCGGLLTGFGLVFLSVSPAEPVTAQVTSPARTASPAPPRRSERGNGRAGLPTFLPGSGMSVKQALERIACG
jgi:uncharacterized protein involved in exopolysaccharide biosynthesis